MTVNIAGWTLLRMRAAGDQHDMPNSAIGINVQNIRPAIAGAYPFVVVLPPKTLSADDVRKGIEQIGGVIHRSRGFTQ